MANITEITAGAVTLTVDDGLAHIEQGTPLTRLHFFDGKFLSADALTLEQDYHRNLVRASNLAGGWGVVHGLGISLSGDQLTVTPGLAITPAGSTVLAGQEFSAAVSDLLKVAAPAPAGGNAAFAPCTQDAKAAVIEATATGIYEITVGPIEGLCGNEAVYGKLCEDVCVSDSQRPYWREGLVLRLRPIALTLPDSTAVALTNTHLRNRVASAYFASEPWLTASLMSAAGLASHVWCNPAQLYGRDEVPIGLLVREGGSTRFIDAWSARRERMDAQARGYWQGRMAMRPWNVFLAQILQFQCQLAALFDKTDVAIKPPDDCDSLRQVLDTTRKELEALHKKYSASTQKIVEKLAAKPVKKDAESVADEMKVAYAELFDLSEKLSALDLGKVALPKNRLLLNAGFVQLPPAGYLPVAPGKADLADQLQRMFGEGVRLHYRAARADVLPHLVEEAQHMERISLTRGLDNAQDLEDVEIFVPEGVIGDAAVEQSGTWWQVRLSPAFTAGFQILGANKVAQAAEAAAPAAAEAVAAPAAGLSINTKATTKAKAKAKAASIYTNINANLSLNTNLAQIQTTMLDGLARTEARPDGSYGVALVAALDVAYRAQVALAAEAAQPVLTLLKDGPAVDAATGNVVLPDTLPARGNTIASRQTTAYLSGDVATDPFNLDVGEETAIKLELRTLNKAAALVVGASGSITVLSRQARTPSLTVLQVVVEMVATSTTYGHAGGPQSDSSRQSVRLALVRRGDAQSGTLVIDDPQFDETSPALETAWDDTPRAATVSLVNTVAGKLVAGKVLSLLSYAYRADAAFASADTERYELLRMDALNAAPDVSSNIGSAALNALVTLADAADDPAFLARARRRLFPQLAATGVPVVKGVEDWVMFRRMRPTFCDPVCVKPVQAAVEAFQVWHLRVANADELKKVQDALDQGNDKVLASLKFRRVGILRYRDESAISEESAARVHAMWELVQPGPQVALARVWESAPATGQGWQNHFRVRNMLDQIADLTQPPARGDGAIAALPKAPGPLDDRALDGGMAVVTMDVAAVTRNALMIYGNWDRPNHFLDGESPHAPLAFADDQPQGSALSDFIAALTANQPVLGVTLATTKAAPDAGAQARLKTVIEALVASGRPAPVATRQTVESINEHDRKEVLKIGQNPDAFDEVIFFELNAGA